MMGAENAGPENARPRDVVENAGPENEGFRRIWKMNDHDVRGCKISGHQERLLKGSSSPPFPFLRVGPSNPASGSEERCKLP